MSREGIKILFKLPLRQTAGMVASLLKLAGLDWQHQLATLKLLREYAALGLTVVASIHDINLACQYADDIWCLHQGKLVANGPPDVITPELIAEVFSVKVRRFEQDGISVLMPE